MNRITSIDQFRGLAIILMVLANFIGGVHSMPAWLKHAPDIGMTIADLVAPMFIFAIGLTYGLSFRRRLEGQTPIPVYMHFVTRYLAILGLGAIISAAEKYYMADSSGVDWGVFQAIGIAGLVTLLVIRLPWHLRGLVGLSGLAAYQGLSDRFFLPVVVSAPHGGLVGAFGWAAMLILATVLADLYHEPRRKNSIFILANFLLLLVGIALSLLSPISKHRVSMAYVLVSTGTSGLIYFLFHWLSTHLGFEGKILKAWGKNPLVLYFLHYAFIGIVFLPGIPTLYTAAPVWLALLEIALILTSLTVVALRMERKQFYITL